MPQLADTIEIPRYSIGHRGRMIDLDDLPPRDGPRRRDVEAEGFPAGRGPKCEVMDLAVDCGVVRAEDSEPHAQQHVASPVVDVVEGAGFGPPFLQPGGEHAEVCISLAFWSKHDVVMVVEVSTKRDRRRAARDRVRHVASAEDRPAAPQHAGLVLCTRRGR